LFQEKLNEGHDPFKISRSLDLLSALREESEQFKPGCGRSLFLRALHPSRFGLELS